MPSEASAIFDAAIRASKLRHLNNKRAAKASQIKSVLAKRCGNCDHWMKNSCVPEKKHGEFKSASSLTCGDFVLSHGSKRLVSQFEEELKEIKNEIAAFTGEQDA